MPFGLREEVGARETKHIIEARNLVKLYRKRERRENAIGDFFFPRYEYFRAVDDVSLEINEGEIFGLLGPNGAGKTTLIKMLCGLLTPNEGTIAIKGRDIEESIGSIGIMFGFSMIYHRLTGYDNLRYFAELYGVENYKERIRELSEMLELGPWIHSFVEQYSSGMKSKLALARVLIHNPDILFLDEPTLGLDPKISLKIRSFIKDLGKTILITTHYMEEANELCDRIGIINKGKIIRVDTPQNLKKLIARNVAFNIGLSHFGNVLLNQLKTQSYIINVELSETGIRVLLRDKKYLSELLQFLSKHKITSVSEEAPTLVDVFVRLTTREEEKV